MNALEILAELAGRGYHEVQVPQLIAIEAIQDVNRWAVQLGDVDQDHWLGASIEFVDCILAQGGLHLAAALLLSSEDVNILHALDDGRLLDTFVRQALGV